MYIILFAKLITNNYSSLNYQLPAHKIDNSKQ